MVQNRRKSSRSNRQTSRARRMAEEYPGAPFPPAAPSSAPTRSRLSRRALGGVDAPYPSARTPSPTTATASPSPLPRRPPAPPHPQLPRDGAARAAEESPAHGRRPDDLAIPDPMMTRSTMDLPLASTIQESTRPIPSQVRFLSLLSMFFGFDSKDMVLESDLPITCNLVFRLQ